MNKNKPDIRFKGFADTWEYRYFTSMVTRVSAVSNATELPRVEYEDIISEQGKLNKDIYQKDNLKIGIEFDKNDILFGKLRPYLKNWLLSDFKGIAVGDFWIFRSIDTNEQFIYYLIQIPYFQKVANQSTGTKMPRSDWSVVSKEKFVIPHKIEEQKKIGKFFKNLDELITLCEHKCKKLKNIKKAMLENMFPKEGFDVPEIRFKGFTDTWKQYKVKDILIERNIQNPKNDEYPLMAFIANEGVVAKGDRYNREFLVNDEKNKKYKQTEYGDFIYSSNNLESGSIGLNKYGKASISPVYSIFQPTEFADSEFIGCLLVKKEFINKMIRWRQGVMYGQWKIHESDFIKIRIKAPFIMEQKKVGIFFKHLNSLINLYQFKYEKLKNIKRAMLEKMFI